MNQSLMLTMLMNMTGNVRAALNRKSDFSFRYVRS
jgi:hypothetical protein